MRSHTRKSKRVLSFLLTFTIVFSMFSGVMQVYAAPTINNVRFMRTIDSVTNTTSEALYIYGTGFKNPFVRVGTTGAIPVTVNTALSTAYMIVINDEASIKEMRGKNNIINVTAENADETTSEATSSMDLSVMPTIEGVSKSKAYVGTPLTISGSKFEMLNQPDSDTTDDITTEDYLYVAGTRYTFGTDCTLSSDSIYIPSLKSPNDYGVSDIRIERSIKKGGTIINEVVTVYDNCITVVNEMTGIKIERIDPNAGPKTKKNIISIYGIQPNYSNFTSDMRIFVGSTSGKEGTNKGVITDTDGKVIGVNFELPTSTTAGTVDLILCSKSLSSEYVIPSAFVYLDIGNTLSIDSDGINPNYKKETEYKVVQVKGRNIGYFNGTGYDKLSNISTDNTIYGYSTYGSGSEFNNDTYYKIKYTGTYNGTAVTIIRSFRVIIDGDAKVIDTVSGTNDYTPLFTLSKDTLYVVPANVNLEPNEAKSVDVSVQTETSIFTEAGGYVDQMIYNRTEEYTITNGFTFLPDEITPTISTVTPGYGPSDKEIYMTITGESIQVLEDGSLPRVMIGGRQCEVKGVYDDDNNIVDGKKIALGTKIKLRLPAGDTLEGAADVVVINPSNGQDTLENGFEFRNPADDTTTPYIDSVVEDYGDLRGGDVSGETVVITGGNIFTSSGDNHRVIITIDGEKAEIVGKVSSDGKTVTIIPPPGTIAGDTQLQLINEDGSMATADFEYRLVTSDPKIISIAPSKGGKGTKLIIKGEDFVLPDNTVANDDPRRKGSVVLLNGYELNAYKYDENGVITNIDPNTGDTTSDIYFYGEYDPDGDGGTDPYTLDGHMIRVQDITTIYIDIPDWFYDFDNSSTAESPYLTSEQIPIGSLSVVVLNPDGAKSQEKVYFEYMNPSTSPVIASVKPNSGSVFGGTVVTITGSGFKADDLEVYFGSELSEEIEFINSTMIKAVVPDYPYTLPNGQDYLDVPVMVMNYDGGVAVQENGFKYRVPGSNPVIKSITPNSGSTAGNDRLVIKGLDFRRTADLSEEGLPKVFFNGEAAAVEWPSGNSSTITETLTVTTPSSLTSGTAEVVLVNHDAGTCIYTGFTYIMSKPAISSVTPSSISKLGNVNVQINGSGFREGNLSKLFTNSVEKVERDSSEGIDAEDAIETLVLFGDEDTGDQGVVNTVLGPMYAEIDDLRFDCTMIAGEIEQVNVRISQTSDTSHSAISRYHMEDGEKVFDSYAEANITVGDSRLFIINHKMDLGSDTLYDEAILVETGPSSVTITRRVAPVAEVEYEGTQVTAVAPPTDRVGSRMLYVINDDGGTAKASITITSPDSSPIITSIDPKNRARESATNQIIEYVAENAEDYSEVFTFIPLSGGAFLTISGSDFRRNVKVYLDDVALEITSKSADDDELVVKIPAGNDDDLEKDKRIIIINEDGGTYDSTMLDLPHYIRYQTMESDPVIDKIVPDKSSSRGSNKIALYGNNFRAGVVVFIEGIACTTTRDADKPAELLSVLVPTGLEPGEKTVQVQNPDFGFTELKNGLTIISTPGITGIYNADGDAIDPLVLSVEGGEELTIKGVQFYEGIKVIFGAELKAKSELEDGESGLEGLNINNADMVIIGGTIAEDATLQEDGSIVCTSPKLDMGSTSIILINTDTGLSDPVSGNYQKPVPDTPDGIEVEAVDGDTLKLEWDYIADINYYELYAAISETGKSSTGTYEYVGSIVPSLIEDGERLRYYLDGLQSSTWYNIRIRSVNLFGASKYSTSTGYTKTLDEKIVTYYKDDTAKVGGLEQNDSVVMKGTELTYTLGEKSISSVTGAVVEFGQPSYAVANPKIVKVSFGLMKKYPAGKIKINDTDIELALKASNLAVDEVVMVETAKKSDTDMQVSINRSVGAAGDEIRIKMPRGYKLMLNPFSVNLNMQVQNTVTRIDAFNGDISLLLKYAESKRSLYPGGIYIAYYDKTTGRIQITNTKELSGKAQSQISKTGEYVLIGKLIK